MTLRKPLGAAIVAGLLGVTSGAFAQTSGTPRVPLPAPPPEVVEAQRRYEECVAQNPDAVRLHRAAYQVRQLVEIRDGMASRPPSTVPGVPTPAEIETALGTEFLEYVRLGGAAPSPEAVVPGPSPCPTPLESLAGQRQRQIIELRKRVIIPRSP